MSAGAGGFIPAKKDVKFIKTEAASRPEESQQGKWGSKKPKSKRSPEQHQSTQTFIRVYNALASDLGYPPEGEYWHFQNVAAAVGYDSTFYPYLVVAFLKDWDTIKVNYQDVFKNHAPDISALDFIKYRLTREILGKPTCYQGLTAYTERHPLLATPAWATSIQEHADAEASKSAERLGKERADINQDRFDFSKSKYVTEENQFSPSLQPKYHNGARIIQENHLEAPGPHIKHGYDRAVVCVELYPAKGWMDAKAVPYLPKWTIKVNGPGENPVLSRFFGYVPDGKYLKSQHESPEAFEHHKKVAVESMAFFIKVPNIYSKFMSVATENPVYHDYDKEYEITLGIARGLPRLGYLTAMIHDMGFPSWESYYDWYLLCYNETIFKLFGGSIKFETQCQGKVPVFTYDFRKDGFMGLNPCEEILDKPFTSVVQCKPYWPIFRFHTDAPLAAIQRLLVNCKEYHA
jgi:hypothetical protein